MSEVTLAKTQTAMQIHVILLGQPCTLKGPFDESTLKLIHSIGPAQINSNLSLSVPTKELENTKKTLDQLRSAKNLPSQLDRYKEKLTKRLDAEIKFLDAVEAFKKSHSTIELAKLGKSLLTDKKLNKYSETIKKLDASNKASQTQELLDQLFELYSEEIEPDPESEYHYGIKKLNIQYHCSFEESEDNN